MLLRRIGKVIHDRFGTKYDTHTNFIWFRLGIKDCLHYDKYLHLFIKYYFALILECSSCKNEGGITFDIYLIITCDDHAKLDLRGTLTDVFYP